MTRKQIFVYALLLGLIGFNVGMMFYSLGTGSVRAKWGWIEYADNPSSYWNWTIGYAVGAIVIAAFLWVMIFNRKG